MQRLILHTMKSAHLREFVAANGLRRRHRALLAPEGQVVGRIVGTDQGYVRVAILEGTRGQDANEVAAWWPAFRSSWVITTADVGVEVGDPLGPGEVICDMCNAWVIVRPVPVVNGYARCAECFGRLDLLLPGPVHLYCPLRAEDNRR